jgi:hypothetical protein
MRFRPNRRVLLAVVVVLLLAVFVPPSVNLESYRKRITGSLEQALGRPVTVSSVNLRLLPQPGFDLQNVVISEDPAFGAEPMLRADEVTAGLRLMSLWRGRLEIARLNFKSPSLNLVRAGDGHWNVEVLLQRASQTSTAPTGQTHAEARTRFPYIQADDGRINFKIGQEKKVYSLSEADFALWLASEKEWAFRLAARPVRVDFNMGDTGQVKLNGRFRPALNLNDTPIEVAASLQDAQLGQLTQLIYGADRGWRGGVDISAQLNGTPSGLGVTTHAAIREFRRYDINSTEPLRLDMHCTARYNHPTDQISDVNCQMPLGNGMMRARGSATGLISPRAYDLTLTAENVGLQALVTLARHTRPGIPNDLAASGGATGSFNLRQSEQNANAVWTGEVQTTPAVLRSSVLSPELALPALTFTAQQAQASPAKAGKHRGSKAVAQPPQPARIVLAGFPVSLGASAPAEASGWWSADGYELRVAGDSRIPRVLQMGRAFGLDVFQQPIEGTAKIDLKVGGVWAGTAPPFLTGSAQLRNVTLPVRGVNAPLQMASANLVLASDGATLQNFNARFTGTPLQVAGWVRMTRNCTTLEQCPITFDLQSDALSVEQLSGLLDSKQGKRSWYNVFSGPAQSPSLMRVQASGRIATNHLTMGTVSASHVTANARLASGKLALTDVRADLFGGRHQGEWQADFTGAQPAYAGSGSFSRVAMAELALPMRDNWASGTVDTNYRLTMLGNSPAEFAKSMSGNASFDWRNGAMRHVVLDGHSGPLQFTRFTGQLQIRNGSISIPETRMAGRAGVYTVSGTASLGRELGLNVSSGGRSYVVSGPLDKPKVAPVAVLKP